MKELKAPEVLEEVLMEAPQEEKEVPEEDLVGGEVF